MIQPAPQSKTHPQPHGRYGTRLEDSQRPAPHRTGIPG